MHPRTVTLKVDLTLKEKVGESLGQKELHARDLGHGGLRSTCRWCGRVWTRSEAAGARARAASQTLMGTLGEPRSLQGGDVKLLGGCVGGVLTERGPGQLGLGLCWEGPSLVTVPLPGSECVSDLLPWQSPSDSLNHKEREEDGTYLVALVWGGKMAS